MAAKSVWFEFRLFMVYFTKFCYSEKKKKIHTVAPTMAITITEMLEKSIKGEFTNVFNNSVMNLTSNCIIYLQ